MAEIDDAELAKLQTAQRLLNELTTSPKTKRAVERQIKQLHPDVVIQDDFDAPVMDEIRAIGEKVDKFLTAQAESRDDSRLESAFGRLRSDGGFTDEGIEKLKKLMVDRKIADPLDAAKVWAAENPPPPPQRPSAFGGTSWGFGGKTEEPDTKLLFEDEDAFAEQEAGRFFQEQAARK